MGTFVYSPGVQVYIQVTNKQTGKTSILDVSDDLTSGTITRRSDGISSFQFTLQNPARKYDYDPINKIPNPIFTPMDRIIVNMKRLKWVRVFTGYLDSVPAFQAWPGEVNLQASCSLKRLQYWYWDSTLAASEILVQHALFASMKNALDGGSANVIRALLKDVVNWPPEKVHIGAIPDNWYDFAGDIIKELVKDLDAANAAAEAIQSATSGTASISGQSLDVDVQGALVAGTNYGGQTLDSEQCSNAETIWTEALSKGATSDQATMAIGCAYDESRLRTNPGSLGGAWGLFQQTPPAWGTKEQCLDPIHATDKFIAALQKVGNQWTASGGAGQLSFTMSIHAVQQNKVPTVYAQWQSMAQAVAQVLVQSDGNQAFATSAGVSGRLTAKGNAGLSPDNIPAPGTASGQDLVNSAIALTTRLPHITYREGGDSTPGDPNPTVLDCSSFVQWVYCNTLGVVTAPIPRTAHEQAEWCTSHGSQRLTVAQGLNTPGALMYHSTNGSDAGVVHTEISLGNGKQTVGAHMTGLYAGVIDTPSEWSFAHTPPSITYPSIGGGDGITVSGGTATVPLQQSNNQIITTDVASDATDPIDKLFGGLTWMPANDTGAEQLSASLVGVRALLNDEPLLPYLINLARCAMRSICSAPNGDFMAWFPDYYGIWGTAAIMVIEDVELMNFSMNWSDLEMITHEFVVQAVTSNFDLGTGTLTTATPGPITLTAGIASIDIGAIMSALFGFKPSARDEHAFRDFIYARFGARVDYQQLQGISGPKGEFFMALFLFMQNWAAQYTATVPMTFMPELWPGMLIQVKNYNFQAYVNTVTHQFTMGPGGSFQTSAEIVAPSRLDKTNPLGYGLPMAGNYNPGPGYKYGQDRLPVGETTQTLKNGQSIHVITDQSGRTIAKPGGG